MAPVLFNFIFIALITASMSVRALEAERLFYLSNGEVLQGCVYKPKGTGPFPVIVFNQNSTKPWPATGVLDPFPELADFCLKNHYVLFVPGRQKMKDDEEQVRKKPNQVDDVEHERKVIHQHEQMAETVFAAIETLKAQSYVDPKHLFVMGFQAGGTTSLLLAEKELNVQGYVIFSPASGVWSFSPILQSELKRAIKNTKIPIFLIQPENDLNLSPSEVLGKELKRKGAPNRTKIYPPFGSTPKDSSHFATTGAEIWGPDALSFFTECLQPEK